MSVIHVLSPHVADLIAAGEVVERPASVIKELMENSFDAGADNVIVEIRNGGATYIRVTDNGCGMAPDDAGTAFLRHATSKLKDESGLASISTMGFRGEALAAISAVSRIELTTRQKGSAEGTKVTLTGGDIDDMLPCGCPDGTTMIVRDLFFNTPARQKFLKSDRSEAAACTGAALRCALAHPEVSVRMIRDGKEEFFSPGDGRQDSVIYALLGREEAKGMLPCTMSSPAMSLSGFVSSPAECRGNRSHQFFFVNGRCIKSLILQTAVEQAYKNSLLVGRYPACVLYLTVDFSSVDVNVHPAKTEIRFGSEKAVFDFVYQGVRLALEKENRLQQPAASFRPGTETVSSPSRTEGETPAASYVSHAPLSTPAPVRSEQTAPQSLAPSRAPAAEREDRINRDLFRGYVPSQPQQTSLDLSSPDTGYSSFGRFAQSEEKSLEYAQNRPSAEKNVENSVQNVETPAPPAYKILGEAFKTYIIVEQNGELLLIDKHAAHERMNFDRLKEAPEAISSQLLLIPVTLHLLPEDAELLEKNGELLAGVGYEIEPFGDRDFILRGIPSTLPSSEAASSVEEILEKLKKNKTVAADSMRDEVLHTVACKAAIKAGWDTQEEELAAVVDAVVSGRVKYCPHGRPISVVLTRTDLDKMFKRIV